MDENALTSVIILKPLIRVKRVEIVFKDSVAFKWGYSRSMWCTLTHYPWLLALSLFEKTSGLFA
jgi:hypothetical protein